MDNHYFKVGKRSISAKTHGKISKEKFMKLFKGIAGDQKLELEFGRYNDLLKTLKSDESEKVDSKQNGKG